MKEIMCQNVHEWVNVTCSYSSSLIVMEVIEKLLLMTLNNGRGWEVLLTVFMRVCQLCGS